MHINERNGKENLDAGFRLGGAFSIEYPLRSYLTIRQEYCV